MFFISLSSVQIDVTAAIKKPSFLQCSQNYARQQYILLQPFYTNILKLMVAGYAFGLVGS